MTEALQTPVATTRRKPRWWLRLLVIVIAIAALGGLAELALRAIIPTVIASVVRDQMHLPKDHPVEVGLGSSALFPALTGHVNDVTLRVDDVNVYDSIHANLYASAKSIPFDPSSGPMKGASASVTIPSDNMGSLMSLITNGLIDEGKVQDGTIELGHTMQMFGFDAHVSASLAVSVEAGNLLIDPSAIQAAGFDLTSEELRPLLGNAAATLLDTHTVCVRDQMPAGITLTSVDLTSNVFGGAVTITAALAPDLLSNPKAQQPGSCEAS